MYGFFPEIQPYQTHQLKVDLHHELYLEECGNPQGIPVLFVHGGPGFGCQKDDRRFFDPTIFRVILFDQRGCGRSTPHAELRGNTSQNLVSDIEKIRRYLAIDKWLVFGGSWGSTLSLLYAQAHPDRVTGLILRGIFLCRPQDIHWFYQYGAHYLYPDYWQEYLSAIPVEEQDNMVQAYYRRLTGDNEIERMHAAKCWSIWEGRCATLQPRSKIVELFSEPHIAMSVARIECHYFVNNSFLTENQILKNMDKIQNIPGIIVHGRYDTICPLQGAWELHQAWPNSQLNIIRDAGHSSSEPGTLDALIEATRVMARAINSEA